jgi:hypothetical protein
MKKKLYSFTEREPKLQSHVSLVWENGSDCECIYVGLDKTILPLPISWYYVKTKTPRKQWTNIAQCYVNTVWAGKETIELNDIYMYLLREAGLEWTIHQSWASVAPEIKRKANYLVGVADRIYTKNIQLFAKGQELNNNTESK